MRFKCLRDLRIGIQKWDWCNGSSSKGRACNYLMIKAIKLGVFKGDFEVLKTVLNPPFIL